MENGIPSDHTRQRLLSAYHSLDEQYGPQHWWPADSPFEIMVGAVLTQNTAWANVEKAIGNLKAADCLDAERIAALPSADLAELIRPSGYFNVKAKRLGAFCRWYMDRGQHAGLSRLETHLLRKALLSVHGVGPETADDMLLYAFGRAVFVIDAYTRRIFSRLDILDGRLSYEALRSLIEGALPADNGLFSQYHALIVQHSKDICRKRPRCDGCCVRRFCVFEE
uniref:DNA-3-methyladenine glycosylase III n=1 Tax=Candidatus Kentrum sp. LPFa TaxID=2126335 RepID=A0A450WH31_9GAMM|nr:MAG: DNA-3-methyladenine glycosylase III [Candidatus Kentron sp. LPFa]